MTPPVLFYSPGSCSLSVQVALLWLDRPHLVCKSDKPARQTEAFLRINPLGKVPALRTADGRLLAEVSALLLHLAHGTRWVPEAGTAGHDAFQQWLSYLGSGFHAAFYPYFNPQRYALDEALQPAMREAATVQVRGQLAYLSNALGDAPWLLGQEVSLLDPYLFAMTRWSNRFVDLATEFPRIAAHQARVQEDPAVQFALRVELEGAAVPPQGSYGGHIELSTL